MPLVLENPQGLEGGYLSADHARGIIYIGIL